MGRREEKREATRHEILAAARRLFETNGYEATSVDDIVLAANLAKGTFYYHFDTKEALLPALQESIWRAAAKSAEAKLARGESPLKVLFWLIAETSHWTEANPDLARSVAARHARHFLVHASHHGDHEHGGPVVTVLRDLLSRAQAAHEIRGDVEMPELLHVVVPVLMATRTMWLFKREGSLVKHLERAMQLLLEGLRPAPRGATSSDPT